MNRRPFYEIIFNSRNAEQNLKGDPMRIFSIHFVAKLQKIAGEPFGEKYFPEKKVSQCRTKTERGTIWSRPVLYVTRETFLVHPSRDGLNFLHAAWKHAG